jgi:parallel beta-helix repeat protein
MADSAAVDAGSPVTNGGYKGGISRRHLLAGAGAAGVIGGITGLAPGLGAGVAAAAGCDDGFVSVKDYGAVGDGQTDDSSAIQDAIDDTTGDGRAVIIPGGVYLVGAPLIMRSTLTLRGIGRGGTVLRLAPSTVGPILDAPQSGGVYQTVDDLVLADLALDGDAEHSTVAGSQSAPLLRAYQSHRWHITRCNIMNSRGLGIGLMGDPRSSINGKQGPHQDTYVVDCHFRSNGTVATGDGIHTKSADRLTLEHCTSTGNRNRAMYIKGRFAALVSCHSIDNPWGIMIDTTPNAATGSTDDDTYMTVLGGSAEGSTGSGLTIVNQNDQSTDHGITRVTVSGFNSRYNGRGLGASEPNTAATDEAISLALLGGQYVHNNDQGISLHGLRDLTIQAVICRENDSHGIELINTTYASISGCQLRNNGQWGIALSGSSADHITTHGNVFKDNGSGAFLNKGLHSKAGANIADQSATVPSAATITLPSCHDSVLISGSTNITSIAGTVDGRSVILRFQQALTVIKGPGLMLAADFAATADDTLSLTCVNGVWYELSRSVNG